jgi:hypothetical protein
MQSPRGTGREPQLVSLIVILVALLSPPTVWGATYSGASVGSNGTTYGWGVTNVTTGSYIHTAYVTTTLRSPKGRTAIRNWQSAWNSVRADISLAWDSTDLGTYTTTSTHKAYCSQMGWFINGATSSTWLYLALKLTFGAWSGVWEDVGTLRYCGMVPACSNGVTPACGAQGWTYLTDTFHACPYFASSYFIAWRLRTTDPWNCVLGPAGIQVGPGPCDP